MRVPIAMTVSASGSSKPTAGASVWMSRALGVAAAKDNPVSKRGSAGRSTTSMRWARPSEVTTAICERAEVESCARIPSCDARGPASIGSAPSTLASDPAAERTTTHGSSGTSSDIVVAFPVAAGIAASAAPGCAWSTWVPVAERRRVRRGVPKRAATSESSWLMSA